MRTSRFLVIERMEPPNTRLTIVNRARNSRSAGANRSGQPREMGGNGFGRVRYVETNNRPMTAAKNALEVHNPIVAPM